jgi:hypothetical protein
MSDLVERISRIIAHHKAHEGDDGVVACSCGAEEVSDHSRHVTEHVIEHLRYASALFDQELTKLEGAE